MKPWGVIARFESLCVPAFFTVSSFLFFRKCWFLGFGNNDAAYLKFIKRLVIVYFFYFFLLSPVIISNRGYMDMRLMESIGTFMLDLLLRYTYPGSWFLSALVVSTTIVYFCGKYIKTYWLLLPLLALHIYVYNTELFPQNVQVLYDWYEEHIRTMRLSFTAALFPVCLGSVLSHPRLLLFYGKIKDYNKYCLLALGVLFAAYCLTGGIVYSYFLLVLIFVFFYNLDLPSNPIYKRLREYSILFFFWHFIVIQVFKMIYGEEVFHLFGVSLFFVVVVIITIISTVILALENKKYFRWLTYSH